MTSGIVLKNIISDAQARSFDVISKLVAAALDALEAAPRPLATLKLLLAETVADRRASSDCMADLVEIVEGAAVDGDNLLVSSATLAPDSSPASKPSMSLSVVTRQPSGSITVRTIEIDRHQLALAGGDSDDKPGLLENLREAVQVLSDDRSRARALTAIDAFSTQVAICRSRLSLVKARLDLQASFLASVFETEGDPPMVRLESDLDQASALVLAFDACRSLRTRPFSIASSNRKVLESLLKQ